MTDSKLIVTNYKGFTTCFKFEDGDISELFLQKDNTLNVNDIYVCRVSNVKKDIKACFVDIDGHSTGFLPFDEIDGNLLINRSFDGVLKQGDLICAQITKEPLKTKFASLSMNISIPGNFSVVTATDSKIHMSSKLNQEDISKINMSLKNCSFNHGFVVRTNASNVSSDVLLQEIKENENILDDILERMKTRSLFTCLYKGKSSVYSKIRSLPLGSFDEIITDDEDIYDSLKGLSPLRLYKDDYVPLKSVYSFDKAFMLATDKKVNLKSGGYIIIEPTEALTVIDVNTGKFDKSVSKQEMIRIVNEEACKEVGRQLKLRNISGIILIDFVNIDRAEDKESLIKLMKSILKKDTVKANYIDITPLGLMEITREKKYASIYDLLKNSV